MPPKAQPLTAKQQLVIPIVIVTLFAGGGLVAGYYGLGHARSYARMSKQPEEISAAQAFDARLEQGPRWVRLKEPLRVNCDQGLQQTSNGSVEFTEYVAYDETGKHAFFVRYKGNTDCAGTEKVGWEGLLKPPPTYWWTANNMPYPTSEAVELQLQTDPSDELAEAGWTFACMAMLLGLAAAMGWAGKKKPKSPERQFQERAAASGR